MINYFIEIFTKPMVLWSVLDKLAVCGLIFGGLTILCLIVWGSIALIGCIKEKICRKRFKTCRNKGKHDVGCFLDECLWCVDYEKKEQNDDR